MTIFEDDGLHETPISTHSLTLFEHIPENKDESGSVDNTALSGFD